MGAAADPVRASRRLAPPEDLTIPRPGSTTARTILSQALRRLLGELAQLPGEVLPGLVREVSARDPGALAALVRDPDIGTLIRCARPRSDAALDPQAVRRELNAAVCLGLAARRALPGPVTLRSLPPRLCSFAARRSLDLDRVSAATFRDGELELDGEGGVVVIDLAREPAERTHLPVGDDLVLALADANPLAGVEAHPEKAGNAIDLGEHPPEVWVDVIRRSLDLVAEFLPDLRAEMGLFLRQIVPVGYDRARHLSASYQEAIGTVYMTLHPSWMTMVEALLHEFSHQKLHALLELDPVLENPFWPLVPSPVRPDPRPLQGVLLAVHAFLPVARLYELMRAAGHEQIRKSGFSRRYAAIMAQNREGTATLLEHARPTAVGRGLLDEIRRWDEHFAGA